MTQRSLAIVCLICCLQTGSVAAQHQHHNHHESRHSQQRHGGTIVEIPAFSYSGMYGSHHGFRPGGMGFYPPLIFAPIQVVSYPYPVSTYPMPMNSMGFANAEAPVKLVTPKGNANPSSPAARLKSLDLQARGDQRMREQKWSEARVAYLAAIAAAPDRATAHMRMAMLHVALQRYDAATREIKRSLQLDPSIAKSADKMEVIFGPDSKMICNSIISKMGTWVKEDMANSERLFLYGVMLQLHSDPRAREMLEAALHTKPVGDLSHISLFLENNNDHDANGFPKLNHRPDSVLIAQPHDDLRFPKAPGPIPGAPVPMP